MDLSPFTAILQAGPQAGSTSALVLGAAVLLLGGLLAENWKDWTPVGRVVAIVGGLLLIFAAT